MSSSDNNQSDLLLLHHLQILQTELRKVDKSIIYHPVKQNELNYTFSTIKKWYNSQHQYPDPFCLDQVNSAFDIHKQQKKNLSLLAMTHPRSFHVYTASNPIEIPQVEPLDTCVGMLRYLNYESHTTLSANHVLMPFFQALNSSSKISLVALAGILEILPTLKSFEDFPTCVKTTSHYLTKLVPKGNEDVLGVLQLLLDIFKLLLDYNMDSEQYNWWISTLLGYIVGKLPDGLKMQAEHCILNLVERSWNDPPALSNLLKMLLSPILPKSPWHVTFKDHKFKTTWFDVHHFNETDFNKDVKQPNEPQVLSYESEGLQQYTIRLLEQLNIILYNKHPINNPSEWVSSLGNNGYIEACLRINGLYALFHLLYNPSTSFPIRFQSFKSLSFILINNYKNPNYTKELTIYFNFLIDAIAILGPNPPTLTHPRVSTSKFKPRQSPQYHPNANNASPMSLFYSPFTQYHANNEDTSIQSNPTPFPPNMPRTYPLWVAMQAVESGDVVKSWSYTNIFLHWFDAINKQLFDNFSHNKINKSNNALLSTLSINKPPEIPNILFKRMWHSHGLLHYHFNLDHYIGPFSYFGHGILNINNDTLLYYDATSPYPSPSWLNSFLIPNDKLDQPSEHQPTNKSTLPFIYFNDPISNIPITRIAVSNEVIEWRTQLASQIESIFVNPDLIIQLAAYNDYNNNDTLIQRLLVTISKFALPDYQNHSHRTFSTVCFSAITQFLSFLSTNSTNSPQVAILNAAFTKSHLLKHCIRVFNTNLKQGLQLLQQHMFINDTPTSIANFLFNTPTLNKSHIGEMLGKPSNIPILQHFTTIFNFINMSIDNALRLFLTKFRLPGESQQIERILTHFSNIYFKHNPTWFNNADAVLILSFSIVMLNTDLHSPHIKIQNKMTLVQFISNLRNTNNGDNFDAGFLTNIYTNIKNDEIVMPHEKRCLDFYNHVAICKCDHDVSITCTTVFVSNWGLFLTLIINIFDYSDDQHSMSLVMDLILLFCKIGCKLESSVPMNALVMVLCCSSGIYTGIPLEFENSKLELNGYYKGQLGVYMLVNVVNKYYTKITEWKHVIYLLKVMYLDDMVSCELVKSTYFKTVMAESSSTLLGTLSSYFNQQFSPKQQQVIGTQNVDKLMETCGIEMEQLPLNKILEHLLEYAVDRKEDGTDTLNEFSVYVCYWLIKKHGELEEAHGCVLVPFMKHVMGTCGLLGVTWFCRTKKINKFEFLWLNKLYEACLINTLEMGIEIIPEIQVILSDLEDLPQFEVWVHLICEQVLDEKVILEIHELLFKCGNKRVVIQGISRIMKKIQNTTIKSQYLDLLFHQFEGYERLVEIINIMRPLLEDKEQDIRQKTWYYIGKMMQNTEDIGKFETLVTLKWGDTGDGELQEEYRMRHMTMMCKMYLQMVQVAEGGFDEGNVILGEIVGIMYGYYSGSGDNGMLREMVVEGIKNVVLVVREIGKLNKEDKIWEILGKMGIEWDGDKQEIKDDITRPMNV